MPETSTPGFTCMEYELHHVLAGFTCRVQRFDVTIIQHKMVFKSIRFCWLIMLNPLLYWYSVIKCNMLNILDGISFILSASSSSDELKICPFLHM